MKMMLSCTLDDSLVITLHSSQKETLYSLPNMHWKCDKMGNCVSTIRYNSSVVYDNEQHTASTTCFVYTFNTVSVCVF